MTIRVLIVDDSGFICKRIKEILEQDPELEVVGIAANGREAVALSATLKPDVITMDVAMPVMDGISAVKRIMAEDPRPILMFSAATHAGAQATLDALSAGAIDFLPKQLDEIDQNRETAKYLLRSRVRLVAAQSRRLQRYPYLNGGVRENRPVEVQPRLVTGLERPQKPDLLVVAASTGGPVAMQTILTRLPADCSLPILLVQHMPQHFTKSFAERLDQLCAIEIREAEDGDGLQAGVALLCPGGMQMELVWGAGRGIVKLRAKRQDEIYAPCADLTFASIARAFSGRPLVIVLTGMGSDGKLGAQQLKRQGAEIWAQDEASSTIYGMPKAIVDAHLADRIYSLEEIANQFHGLN